jgi:hypothetical protein
MGRLYLERGTRVRLEGCFLSTGCTEKTIGKKLRHTRRWNEII